MKLISVIFGSLIGFCKADVAKTGDEIPKINVSLPDPSKPSDIFWVKAAQHTLPVGFAKSVQKVECFNDMIEILFVGEENEEMVLPCKISFTKRHYGKESDCETDVGVHAWTKKNKLPESLGLGARCTPREQEL